MRSLIPLVLLLVGVADAAAGGLDACIGSQDLPRIARVLGPDGTPVFARVVEEQEGRIRRAVAIAPAETPLRDVFARVAAAGTPFDVTDEQVCSVVSLPERALDAEERVIVSTGLNYAAHAEEAGGGEVFLFPKPAAPTRPYAPVHAPAGVTLLDYEVELAFVLLDALDPADPPSREQLLARSAFFLSNDVSDREAIIRNAALSGGSSGFPEAKGQPGFFPTGPWMVRGTELFAAAAACGAEGLGLRLWVNDESEPRQAADTTRMILAPHELVARIGSWMEEHGVRSTMPFRRGGAPARHYPFAVGEPLALPAGSIVQTGTPEGVALNAPSPLGVTLRGLVRLRGPFAQFLAEEKARVAAGGTRYLAPGDRVRARIDGLGEQRFRIGEAGGRAPNHPCDEEPRT